MARTHDSFVLCFNIRYISKEESVLQAMECIR